MTSKFSTIAVSLLVVIATLLGVIAFSPKPEQVVQAPTTGVSNQYDGFVVEKLLTSSDIASTSATSVTNPVSGQLYLENLILRTNSPGIAGCTNLMIRITGNTYGTSTVLNVPIAKIGTSSTFDMYAANASSSQRTLLEDGASLEAIGTVAPCTGAGKITITAVLKKAAAQGSKIFD